MAGQPEMSYHHTGPQHRGFLLYTGQPEAQSENCLIIPVGIRNLRDMS